MVTQLEDLIAPARLWNGGLWMRCGRGRSEEKEDWIGHVCDKLEWLDGPEIPRLWGLHLWRARIPT